MVWVNGKLALNDVALPWLNRLNEKVYAVTSIPADDGREMLANAQPFFVSRTRFEECQYTHASIAPILERIGVRKEGYKKDGLFVLRSTVMNPWYSEAEQAGMDYLYEFVRHLHKVAYAATVDTERAMLVAAQSERSRLST